MPREGLSDAEVPFIGLNPLLFSGTLIAEEVDPQDDRRRYLGSSVLKVG